MITLHRSMICLRAVLFCALSLAAVAFAAAAKRPNVILIISGDLPGLDLLDRGAMTSRKSIFIESYTHAIADLGDPAKSLVAQVVINGWSKLLIPGPTLPDKSFASALKTIELFDLKSEPMETNNVAASRPDEVKRLQAIQQGAWDLAKGSERKAQP